MKNDYYYFDFKGRIKFLFWKLLDRIENKINPKPTKFSRTFLHEKEVNDMFKDMGKIINSICSLTGMRINISGEKSAERWVVKRQLQKGLGVKMEYIKDEE